MIINFFALLLLGHLTGDFLFQNKWMALNKSGKWFPCLVHCIIYSVTVAAFTFPYSHSFFIWPLVVFATHFPIDYFSVADKWLDLINGRSLTNYLEHGHEDIEEFNHPSGYYDKQGHNHHILRGGFTAVVYAVTDNTMHLILMYIAACLLF